MKHQFRLFPLLILFFTPSLYGDICSLASTVVPNLFDCLGTEIFKEDLFLKSSDLNARSLLDLPLFMEPLPKNNKWYVKAHLFWNQTSENHFTKGNHTIDSYLAIQESSLTTKIQNLFDTIQTNPCGAVLKFATESDIFDIDVHKTFGLFKNITTEERRIGFMFEAAKNIYAWNIALKLPLYYRERNFWLNLEEQDDIQNSSMNIFPSSSDSFEEPGNQFNQTYMIADRFGIGDTRFTIGYTPLETKRFILTLGPEATIPTEFSMQKGVYGSTFKDTERPEIDLCDIFDLIGNQTEQKDRLTEDINRIGRAWLKTLAEMVLEKPMGNGRHVGLGLFIEPVVQISDNDQLYVHGAIEHIFSATEKRFYIKPVNLTEFSSYNFSSVDSTISANNMNYLNRRLLEMFFPEHVHVKVSPKMILKLTTAFIHEGPSWGFKLGADVWGHKEETVTIKRDEAFIQTLDLPKVVKPSATQAKIFGSASMIINKPKQNWKVEFGIDKTVINEGIGRDFTVSLNVSTQW